MRNGSRFSVMALPAVRFLAAAAIITACAGVEVTDPDDPGPVEPPVRAVSLSPRSGTLSPGAQMQLVAAVTLNGSPDPSPSISWHSSNTSVATVNSTGVVQAVNPGAVTVVAAVGTVSDRADLTVVAPTVPVASVVMAPTSASVAVGATVTLAATPRSSTGQVLTGRAIAWSSSNTAIATVTQGGVVQGLVEGAVTITAQSEGQSATAAVTVSPVPVASVSLSSTSMSLTAPETRSITAFARDGAGAILTGRPATWSSSNAAVATVASTGASTANVSTAGAGTATIIATIEGRTASAQVTVAVPAPAPVSTVTLSPTSANLTVGSTQQITPTLRDASGNTLTGRTITWTSNANSIASVSTSGLITAVAVGNATVTATSEGRSASVSVAVTAPPPVTLAFTNEPSGMTLLANTDWTSWTDDWQNERASTVGLARLNTDATAPMSPSGVLEQFYATGMEGGTAPGNVIFHNTNGAHEVFVGFWYKMSPDFEGYPGGTNKLINVWTPAGIQWLRINSYAAHDNDGSRQNGPYYLVATIDSRDSDLMQNQGGSLVPIVPGRWHKIEWHVTLPSNGLSNGRIRWWLDGVLLGDYPNRSSTDMGPYFQELQISPTWGGGGGHFTTRDSYMRFDHVRISRR